MTNDEVFVVVLIRANLLLSHNFNATSLINSLIKLQATQRVGK